MIVSAEKEDLLRRIEEALNTVRPHLKVDNGDVEVVELTDDMRVKIRWIGMCETCTMSSMTLKAGITAAIQSKIPEIVAVEPINGMSI